MADTFTPVQGSDWLARINSNFNLIPGLELIAFAGAAAAGPCTATGLKVGDVILSVTGVVAADVGDQSALFETVVTVNNQIQQVSASNLSTKVYHALVLRMS